MKNNLPMMVFGVKSCEPVKMKKERVRRAQSTNLTDRGQCSADEKRGLRPCPRHMDVLLHFIFVLAKMLVNILGVLLQI